MIKSILPIASATAIFVAVSLSAFAASSSQEDYRKGLLNTPNIDANMVSSVCTGDLEYSDDAQDLSPNCEDIRREYKRRSKMKWEKTKGTGTTQ